MKPNIKIFTLLIFLALTGCKKYLDKPPAKNSSLKIENTEALDLLLNFYNISFDRSRELILGTDNYGIYKDYFNAKPSAFESYLPDILWFPELLEQQSYYWENQYLKIAYANTILETIAKVEGTEQDKKRLTEDAHLLRAYEYFQLASLYCLPYSDANRNQLGLPLKTTLSYVEDVKRKTLGETMDFIEDEMELALQTSEPRDVKELWRVNKPGVQAFAARFYLYLHDYKKALSFAEAALSAHSALINYESFFKPTMQVYSSNGGTYTGPNALVDNFRFDELYFSRLMYNHVTSAVPSQELINLYDQKNDYRYEGFFVEDYSLSVASKKGWPGYWQFGELGLISGPSTAEMLLIRAECKARDNDVAGAISDLNKLRRSRYKNGTYTDLVPTGFPNTKSLVQFIIDERRREFPFTLRWYDIKRINSDPANIVDKISITRDFYAYDGNKANVNQAATYKLEPGDKRFAWPLPRIDIQLSKGEIEQNPYD